MTVRRLLLIFSLAGSAALAQYCDKIDQRDADAILGGSAMPLSVGAHGCSYSVRGKGVRLTLMLSDEGATTKAKLDDRKKATKRSGWFIGEEAGLGGSAYSELIRGTTGKCGFVVMKGSKLIEFYVSDSGGKSDLAGRRETLDKLRPIAKRVIDRI